MEVLFVDKPISVLVDHVEGLLKLLNLGLVKHGEDIGSGALRALLRGLSLSPFARHCECFVSVEINRHQVTHLFELQLHLINY